MSDFDNVVPDWGDVPEDDAAEPDDLTVEHSATPEEVEELIQAEDDQEDDGEVEDIDQYHTGNGWYDIPGHEESIHGKEAARQALAENTEDEA